MSEGARLLSLVYALFRLISPWEWVMAVVLGIWGLTRLDDAPQTAYLLWACGGMVVLAARIAAAADWAAFVPTDLGDATLTYTPQQRLYRARATGELRKWIHPEVRLPVNVAMVQEPVQVRWLAQGRPPAAAVLSPADIPANAYDPVEKAEEWSLWYPGSTVEVGWVYVNGSESPGLRLSFAGRRLLLALEDDESCRELAALLAE